MTKVSLRTLRKGRHRIVAGLTPGAYMDSVLSSCTQAHAHGRYHTINRPGFLVKPGPMSPNVTCAPVARNSWEPPATSQRKRIPARRGNRSPAWQATSPNGLRQC